MDYRQHEQALQNIRSKYAQNTPSVTITKANRKETASFDMINDLSFRTPIKGVKKQEAPSKESFNQALLYPNPPQLQAYQSLPPQQSKTQSTHHIISHKLSFTKDKGRDLDDFLTEREKQLTERVERNRQLLSKSKEVREKESRNGSVEHNHKITDKQQFKKQIEQLKCILKDNNCIPTQKGNKKQTSGFEWTLREQQPTYSSIKSTVTEKAKKKLAENMITKQPTSQLPVNKGMIPQENTKMVGQFQRKPNCLQEKEGVSLIKTPIPPPKDASPIKISSIFQNTHKIEQRIHALLSR